MHAPAISSAAQPRLESRARDVERGIGVGCSGFGPDDRALGMTRELHTFADVGLSRIALLADLDVESSHLLAEAFELAELADRMLAETLGNGGVPALDGDVHAGPPRRVIE